MSNKIQLFAGLNGIDGYVPLLEYTLSPMKRVFILKGSPGSGKSTVMKRIAARAEAEGHALTVIRCSSDPDSLDGVMLTDLGVAVADGTSPHSLDPKKYGIREVTVSLEDTFDYDRLGFFSGRLGRLFEKKAMYVRAASSCIAAFGKLEDVRREYTDSAFLAGKLYTFCRGFVKRNCRKGDGRVVITPTDTFCRKGFVTTGTFCDVDEFYVLRDRYGSAETVLQQLYAHARNEGVDMCVIPCPVDNREISGIFFPDTGVLIKSDRFVSPENAKTVRAARFLDPEVTALHRQSLTVIEKLSEKLTDEASQTMERAFAVHGEIEKIYSQCIDFGVTDSITKALAIRIFGS